MGVYLNGDAITVDAGSEQVAADLGDLGRVGVVQLDQLLEMERAAGRFAGLLEPMTYMNRSGESLAAVAQFEHNGLALDAVRVAYVTQTTLSVDETSEIISALRARYPAIHAPKPFNSSSPMAFCAP